MWSSCFAPIGYCFTKFYQDSAVFPWKFLATRHKTGTFTWTLTSLACGTWTMDDRRVTRKQDMQKRCLLFLSNNCRSWILLVVQSSATKLPQLCGSSYDFWCRQIGRLTTYLLRINCIDMNINLHVAGSTSHIIFKFLFGYSSHNSGKKNGQHLKPHPPSRIPPDFPSKNGMSSWFLWCFGPSIRLAQLATQALHRKETWKLRVVLKAGDPHTSWSWTLQSLARKMGTSTIAGWWF